LSIAATQVALGWSAAAYAQTPPAPAASASAPARAASAPAAQSVVISGQRQAIMSAQKLKQNAEEVVDSIVADDIGKLPDRSVTEVLQRIVGVTMDRTMSRGDPEHFSVEGSGVVIRGLTFVRSELNGRDSFSANSGRSLSFEDVPPELLAGVDVYKNPSAEQIEGGIAGLVNLRTAMPFDFKGPKLGFSVQTTNSTLRKKQQPSVSLLLSNRWDTDLGEFGALIDLARSKNATRTDSMQVDAYYPTDVTSTRWFPKALSWRTLEYDRDRTGQYAALQWKKDKLESALTVFKSDYHFKWAENAIFSQNSPANTVITNGVFDSRGALVSGTMTNPADGGISMDTDTRYADRESSTRDLTWNLRWKPNDRWTLTSDYQTIHSKTHGFDSTVATGVTLPKENIDLTGEFPRINFDASDLAYLANPANYYWAFTMENIDESRANQKAWKGDAKYKFDDPVLVDLRFGVRLTDRDALTQNSNPYYHWATVTHPWQLPWDVNQLARLSRFGGDQAYLHQFNNFMNGKASVPGLWVPTQAAAKGYPDSYTTIHNYYEVLCAEAVAAQGFGCFNHWNPSTFGTDPAFTNDQREKTKAAYAQLRFDLEDKGYPIDGNVGLRVVQTQAIAHGYTTMNVTVPEIPPGGSVQGSMPGFNFTAQKQDFDKTYNVALPSLNLRLKGQGGWQYRMAYSHGISRPDFSDLQGSTALTASADVRTAVDANSNPLIVIEQVKLTGDAKGNPLLTPVKSKQLDLTAEWYFARNGSLTFAAFNKDLKDIIVKQTFFKPVVDTQGRTQNFVVNGPVNGAKGWARGLEVAYQQYYDGLPGWLQGFGLQANYTFVDSKQKRYNAVYQPYCTSSTGSAANANLNINGCDTNGQSFPDLPLQNLSRHTYNIALLFDRGGWSSKLAYNWRSKYLYGVNLPGTNATDGLNTDPDSPNYGQRNVAWGVPVWAAGYGQLDGSISYKFDNNVQLAFEGQNLTNTTYKQLMQQHVGMMGRYWYVTGPRYTLSMRYSY
jgi:iron complex outermembrane recepter protein